MRYSRRRLVMLRAAVPLLFGTIAETPPRLALLAGEHFSLARTPDSEELRTLSIRCRTFDDRAHYRVERGGHSLIAGQFIISLSGCVISRHRG